MNLIKALNNVVNSNLRKNKSSFINAKIKVIKKDSTNKKTLKNLSY